MKIKESHVTLLLLCTIILSSIFKPKEVNIPVNTITIIDRNQIPIFPPRTIVEDEIAPDTSKLVSTDKNSKSNNDWLRRYREGIRFKFHPPN